MLVGITGSNGFIGTHLVNFFSKISKVSFIQIFKDDFNNHKLHEKVSKCDVIIHLAGLNRHNDSNVIFDTNIDLTKKLITALKKSQKTKHLIFSSSTQESRANSYGKSKRKSQELFSKWAETNSKYFTNLLIPNVFGPYCKPHYNSVISTFSFQLINNINPSIINDNDLELVYVQNLVIEFDKITRDKLNRSKFSDQINIKFDKQIQVSKILEKLKKFKKNYIDNGIIPNLTNEFDKNLFITFSSYLDDNFFPRYFDVHEDNRGSFSEVVRSKSKGQFSYSITKSGVIRGEHFHTRKIERFIVISGKAEIKIRRVNEKKIKKFLIDDSRPSYIDIPVWSTHNIKNIGNNDLITLFWINEHYDEEDHDTFHELVEIK
tara:strand:- start:1754 stop:2881 length:1128 start_codon:yes stop_codon:yes gene_type:complete